MTDASLADVLALADELVDLLDATARTRPTAESQIELWGRAQGYRARLRELRGLPPHPEGVPDDMDALRRRLDGLGGAP